MKWVIDWVILFSTKLTYAGVELFLVVLLYCLWYQSIVAYNLCFYASKKSTEVKNWSRSPKMLTCLKRLCRMQKRFVIFLVATCMFCIMILSGSTSKNREVNKMVQMPLVKNLQNETGTSCELPKLNPFSEQAVAYSKNKFTIRPIVCDGPDWVTCKKDECFVINDILKSHKSVVCSYRDIIFVSDSYRFMAKATTVLDSDKYLLNRSDHVKINCTGVKIENCKEKISIWEGYKAGFRPIPLTPRAAERKDTFNVLMLGINSASHNGFIRGMPKSYKYLKEQIKAVFLNGHHIIGDGTPAALFPILTGYGESQQPEELKKGLDKRLNDRKFIFRRAKNDGYRTAFFEDMPQIGTFQYRYNGFNNLPADHYLQPLLIEEFNHRTLKYGKHLHCIGGDPSYEVLLNLTAEFIELDGKKFCFTFLVDLTHDDFNLISNGDENMLQLLKMVVDKNMLEDTLLVVMGDHGVRYEGIRNTHQGRIEERLPLMAIALPERLKRNRPHALAALLHNKDMLTTHYDIHTTLLDVLDLSQYSNLETVSGASMPRAFSLLEKIPETRTCSEAGILPHWCVCVKWYNVSQSDAKYKQVGKVFTDYINAFTDDKRDICAKRELTSIEWVLKETSKNIMLKYIMNQAEVQLAKLDKNLVSTDFEYFQAKIITNPGQAIYEGTLMYDMKTEFYYITASEVSRIDQYGNESACISETDPYLNKFCYCKEKSPETDTDNYVLYVP